jgi:hypothetical protein
MCQLVSLACQRLWRPADRHRPRILGGARRQQCPGQVWVIRHNLSELAWPQPLAAELLPEKI